MRYLLGLLWFLSGVGCVKVTETVVVFADATPTTPDGGQEPTTDTGVDGGAADIGLADSGAADSGSVDVREGMVLVPGGVFLMGCDTDVDDQCEADEPELREVEVDTFQIDRTEVTVAAYAACVVAETCTEPDTGMTCNWNLSVRNEHPINCVDWDQARSYCVWVGKDLPTEAQWEKAARGTDGWLYPWGNTFDATRANVLGPGDGFEFTAPVESFSAGNSPYGAADMAGNVAEWVLDWYALNQDRSIRGGNWTDGPGGVRASHRNGTVPNNRGGSIGFRCAQSE